MGSIYKRGNIFWLKYFKDGKPYYESSKSRKETVAKRLMKKREGEIQDGKLPGSYYEKVTFEALEEMFIRDRRINNKSVSDAEKRLKHLKPVFGGVKVPNIKSDRIAVYIDGRLNEGAANATINRELAALRRMLNLGYRAEKVQRVPYIGMLKEDNVRTGFLEDFEYEALRDALPSHLKGFLTFGYMTGWRKEEVAGLTWDRVDLQERTVRLNADQTKNKEARNMYMEDSLLDLMFEQWAEKNGPYVFHRDRIKIKNFRKAWNTGCRDAGIGYGYKSSIKYAQKWEEKGMTSGPIYHDLRRTAVKHMAQAGIDRKIAMMRTGHKTESVYNRYNIGTDADLKNAAQQLEAHRNGAEKDVEAATFTQEQQALMLSYMMVTNQAMVTKKLQSPHANEKGVNQYNG